MACFHRAVSSGQTPEILVRLGCQPVTLGKPHPVNEGLARLAGKLSQLGRELGLSPVAERVLHLDAATKASDAKWLALADMAESRSRKRDEEVVPASAPANAPALADTNGTSIPRVHHARLARYFRK
jgi:hypothetical protein